MAKTFHLTVARVGTHVFNGDAVSLTAPGAEGVLTVLAHHAPLVSPLCAGTLLIEAADGQSHHHDITGGILEVSNNQATVLL